MNSITLTPSYGRDYKSAKEAKESFLGGKDWIVASISNPYCGRQCSILDLKGFRVELRYKKLTKVAIVTVKQLDSIIFKYHTSNVMTQDQTS